MFAQSKSARIEYLEQVIDNREAAHKSSQAKLIAQLQQTCVDERRRAMQWVSPLQFFELSDIDIAAIDHDLVEHRGNSVRDCCLCNSLVDRIITVFISIVIIAFTDT